MKDRDDSGPVHFVSPTAPNFTDTSIRSEDYEASDSESAWIVLTYLRMREAGNRVALTRLPPPEGTVVVLARDFDGRYTKRRGVNVVVRADRGHTPDADVEIVQNRSQADGWRSVFVQHWPQPGLTPRSPDRDSHVATVGIVGIAETTHPHLMSDDFAGWCAARNIAVRHLLEPATWADMSDLDLAVSLRPDLGGARPNKPPTKLVNSWIAGVPAVLGPEMAYRSLGHRQVDYLEAGSLDRLRELIDEHADEAAYRDLLARVRARGRATDWWANASQDWQAALAKAELSERQLRFRRARVIRRLGQLANRGRASTTLVRHRLQRS